MSRPRCEVNSGEHLAFRAPGVFAGSDGRPSLSTEVSDVQAAIGERLLMHANKVGAGDMTAEIIEVRGEGGAPPYLVRFPDGHESLVFPGSDCTVQHEGSARET
jgi:hypothetical protein